MGEAKIPFSYHRKMGGLEANKTEAVVEQWQDRFNTLLNFLNFVVNKRCFTEEHYHSVRDEFVM